MRGVNYFRPAPRSRALPHGGCKRLRALEFRLLRCGFIFWQALVAKNSGTRHGLVLVASMTHGKRAHGHTHGRQSRPGDGRGLWHWQSHRPASGSGGGKGRLGRPERTGGGTGFGSDLCGGWGASVARHRSLVDIYPPRTRPSRSAIFSGKRMTNLEMPVFIG